MKCHGCVVNEYISELEDALDAVTQYGVDLEFSGTPAIKRVGKKLQEMAE
jgi:hypothetical protein